MDVQLMSPRHLKVANWIILAALVLLGWLWLGGAFALGILVGGLLAIINFYALAHVLSGTLNRSSGEVQKWEVGGRQGALFLKNIIRLTLMGVIIYFVIKYNLVNIWGLVVGLSIVVLTLILMGINEIRKLYLKEAIAGNGTSNSIS
ncbi:MAG: ATP synthase subunit I [Deltaproteobacteria bacterium]|nr:ATP synthase subunit I [Deltaproteobacteria bacterium]